MSTDAPAAGAVPGGASVRGWRAAFPPARWLPTYRASWLPNDAIAGVTLAAYGIPVSLAYASLAGLPPQYGVYGYLAGGLGYALFGSSRQLAIGPTSAISLLVGVTIAGMAAGDPARDEATEIKRPLPVRGAAFQQLTGTAGSYFFSSVFGLHFSQTLPSFLASTQHLWLHSLPASFAFSQQVLSAANDADMSSAVAQANAVRSLVMFINLACR